MDSRLTLHRTLITEHARFVDFSAWSMDSRLHTFQAWVCVSPCWHMQCCQPQLGQCLHSTPGASCQSHGLTEFAAVSKPPHPAQYIAVAVTALRKGWPHTQIGAITFLLQIWQEWECKVLRLGEQTVFPSLLFVHEKHACTSAAAMIMKSNLLSCFKQQDTFQWVLQACY